MRAGVDIRVKLSFLDTVMSLIDVTFDEKMMKKESNDELKRLFDAMYSVFPIAFKQIDTSTTSSSTSSSNMGINASEVDVEVAIADFQEIFQQFWLRNTLKLLRCNSIVLRLFGWEQVQDILRIAVTTRPLAASYSVSNSAENHINGIYEFVGLVTADSSPKYEKNPDFDRKHENSGFVVEENDNNENKQKDT